MGDDPPAVGQADPVAGLLEQRDRLTGLPLGLLGPASRPGHLAQVEQGDRAPGGQEAVVGHLGAVDRLGEDLVGPPPLARLGKRVAQVEQPADPLRVAGWQQVERAGEQVHGRGRVVAAHGPPPAARESPGAPDGQLHLPGTDPSELLEIAVGLLEVVASDLVLLRQHLPLVTPEPVGQALMQLGAPAFGQRLVAHVTDQEVAEPEPLGSGRGGVTVGGAARSLGTDQLSADQHGQA